MKRSRVRSFPILKTKFVAFAASMAMCFCQILASPAYAVGDAAHYALDPRSSVAGDGAITQRADIPSGVFPNPASLIGISRPYLTANRTVISEGITANSAHFGLPTMYGQVALSFLSLDYGSFNGLDASFNKTEVGLTQDGGFVIGFAAPIATEIPVHKEFAALGVNLKFLRTSLAGYSSEAVALDVGGIYYIPFLEGFSAGLALRNIGSSMKFVKDTAQLPSESIIGIGYSNEQLSEINVTIDHISDSVGSASYAVGLSFSPVYFMNLRLGSKISPKNSFNGVRAGFGLNFGDFNIDYAFIPNDLFEPVNTISFGLAIGNVFQNETASDYYLNKHFHEALGSYHKRDYIDARRKFEDILSAYPDHVPSHKYLENIIVALETKDKIRDYKISKWIEKAQTAVDKKNYILATKYYNRVLYFSPANQAAKDGLDNIKVLVGEVRKDKIVQKNLGTIEGIWKKANRLYRKGDIVKAKEEFVNILVIYPDSKEVKRRIEEIDDQLTRIAVNKVNELFGRGTDLYRSGQYEEAIKYFEAVLLAAPNRVDAMDFAKKAKENISDIDTRSRTEKLAAEQQKMKGEMASVYESALKSYQRGNYVDALRFFQRSEEMAIRYEFQDYLQNTKQYLAVVKQALTEKHYKQGSEYARSYRYEAAVAELKKALEYNPDNTSAAQDLEKLSKELAQRYYEQGMGYFSRSELDKAREMFKRSLLYEPNKAESRRALERMNQ